MKKRRLIDEEGRIFGVISVVDILAVLVVAVLAVMLIGRFASTPTSHYGQTGGKDTSLDAKITCEIYLPGVREFTISAFQPGDEIHDPETGNTLGIVTAVRQEPYIQQVNTTDGRVVDMETEGYIDLYVTLEGTGTVVDGHCYLGGEEELIRNVVISIVTPYVSTSARVVAFRYEVGE